MVMNPMWNCMTKQDVLNRLWQDMKLRGLSEHTQADYLIKARRFQEFYDKPTAEMSIDEVRDYLLHLSEVKKLASGSVNAYNSALRFLYNISLDMSINIAKIPRHKRSRKFPEILTRAEIQTMLDACDNLRDKCMLATTYSAGLRVSEIVTLRVKDIDSKKMQIFIRQGKGNKDRFAVLSKTNLQILREYWLTYRPKDYLFISRNRNVIGIRAFQELFKKYVTKAGITKHLTAHSLRHSFAMHLLEDGVSIFDIKQLLGHSDLSTTCFYLRLTKISEMNVQSPFDRLSSDKFDEVSDNDNDTNVDYSAGNSSADDSAGNSSVDSGVRNSIEHTFDDSLAQVVECSITRVVEGSVTRVVEGSVTRVL